MIKKLFFIFVSFSLLVLPLSSVSAASTSALAEEQGFYSSEVINSYESVITLDKNGSMTVVETINVTATNDEINHGIYRDFPTVYDQPGGFKRRVPFDIVSIKRGGKNEPYHTEFVTNGTRVFIGHEDVTLTPGKYVYEITYKTDRQVGFFTDHDELYWNVNGNGWSFPVVDISTTVILPSEVKLSDLNIKGYTGPQGSTEESVRFSKSVTYGKPTVYMEATRTLAKNEGLTFVIGFPKDIIPEPNAAVKQFRFITDNFLIILGAIVTTGLVIYYPVAWYLFGRDKGHRISVPQYEPLKGISAGATRYLTEMGYDTKALTAAIIEMAVKGYIKIIEGDSVGTEINSETTKDSAGNITSIKKTATSWFGAPNGYSVILIGKYKELLTPDEQVLADLLFTGGMSAFEFKQSHHTQVQSIITGYESQLKALFRDHFTKNYWFVGIGLALTGLFLASTSIDLLRNGSIGILFFIVFALFWDFGLLAGIKQIYASKGINRIISLFFLVIFLVPSLCLTGVVLIISYNDLSVVGIVCLVIHFVLQLIFINAMKARSEKGTETQNGLDGFKRYLMLAEKERIEFFNKELPKDIKTYEKYLPYAIAFGIETQWSAEFKETIDKAKADGYEPSWYSGYHMGFYSANFGNSFSNSFSSTVSSASVDPSSSSGFSGGSGGGGGGGGGGGW